MTCASAIDCGMPCCVHVGRCYKALELTNAQLTTRNRELEARLEGAAVRMSELEQQLKRYEKVVETAKAFVLTDAPNDEYDKLADAVHDLQAEG